MNKNNPYKNNYKNLDKFGERVPTQFVWLSPEEQEAKARRMEELDDEHSSS